MKWIRIRFTEFLLCWCPVEETGSHDVRVTTVVKWGELDATASPRGVSERRHGDLSQPTRPLTARMKKILQNELP